MLVTLNVAISCLIHCELSMMRIELLLSVVIGVLVVVALSGPSLERMGCHGCQLRVATRVLHSPRPVLVHHLELLRGNPLLLHLLLF